VAHHWLVDLDACTPTAYRLEGGRWVELGTRAEERKARIEPFDAVPLGVSSFWPAAPKPQAAPKKRKTPPTRRRR
jgi:hypothetical protein